MPRFINKSFVTTRAEAEDGSLETSVRFLEQALPKKPEILVILGSGLGAYADSLDNATVIPYGEIPGFRNPTAPGHKGQLVTGVVAGKNVALMQGRFHVYEGYTPAECAFPVMAFGKLGVKKLVVTCAAGGINEKFAVGDMVLVSDYINLTCPGPLIGFDHSGYGERFIDMSNVFDKAQRSAVKKSFPALGEGVYFYMPGAQFETPAEIRAVKSLGGDLVGMSLVHEAIMARRCGMSVLGICLVTNLASGISKTPLSDKDVYDEGKKACENFGKLLGTVLPKI